MTRQCHKRTLSGWTARLAGALGLLAVTAAAQLPTPLYIGADSAIRDEYGRKLPGNTEAPGALVQILRADQGQLHPPAEDGTPHPDNPVLAETAIGALSSPFAETPAVFGHLMSTNRPANGVQIAVRVFNGETLGQSTFYSDSQVFTVNMPEVFMARLGNTKTALKPDDADGDGLSESWETSLGTNPYAVDTDGDGATDAAEKFAGTDALDRDSVFTVKGTSGDNGTMGMTWEAIPGRTYTLEATTNSLTSNPVFQEVGDPVVVTNRGMVHVPLPEAVRKASRATLRLRVTE